MKSIEQIKIQLLGIKGSIEGYTSNPSITAVLDALLPAIERGDYEIILFSCHEIRKWYEKSLREILSNNFCYYKETHVANADLIKEIILELESNSEEYKRDLDAKAESVPTSNFSDATLANLLNRFHQVVVQLRDRYNDRETIDVSDEYDVQDLLHALLRLYCDDIRPEEWTPSYAGTSSRQDFLLKREQLVIETKRTRKGLGNKELANELIIDIARYATHPDCKTLVCFVYDPESRIKNPRGFESDLSKTTGELTVQVYIRP